MADRAATIIQRRAWSQNCRFMCKSICDRMCADAFGADLADRVWCRLGGAEVAREEVPIAELEQALRFLGSTKSDERWMELSEPPPAVFDDPAAEDPFQEYWSCDEDFGAPEPEPITEPEPDLEPPAKRPRREKKVRPPQDVCDRCHGNGCVRCGWRKNMW